MTREELSRLFLHIYKKLDIMFFTKYLMPWIMEFLKKEKEFLLLDLRIIP